MKRDVDKFAVRIGLKFIRPELLVQAFTHRSYLNEHPSFASEHNERLEFLGDAVLELVVTDHLFTCYPKSNEGELTAYRAAAVNAETLSELASELGINDYLLLSRGESKDTGRARQMILANTFESVVGAIYLDQGLAAARGFVDKYLFPKIGAIVENQLWQDAKSSFQERAQALRDVTPIYKVLEERGPDHNKVFVVGLYLNEELVAKGEGTSKQRAEQEAARLGLERYGWI